MKTKTISFGDHKLRDIPAGALILFYELLNEAGWEGVSIDHAFTEERDRLNSNTEIWFRRRSAAKKFEGGIHWSMEKEVFYCHHANDFSCSSSGLMYHKDPNFPDFDKPKTVMFLVSFRSGGWNTLYAKNLEDAKLLAEDEFGKYGVKEVRRLTKKEYDIMLYMTS
jgi:hypothetical protein